MAGDQDLEGRIRAVLTERADQTRMDDGAAALTDLVERAARRSVGWRRAGRLVQRHRRPLALVAALAGVAAVAVVLPADREQRVDVGVEPPSTVVIPAGDALGVRAVAVGSDSVWLASSNDRALYRIDPADNSVIETLAIDAHVEGVQVVGDALWLSRFDPDEIVILDPDEGVQGRVAFASQPALDVRDGQVWAAGAAAGGGTDLRQLDPATGAVLRTRSVDGSAGFLAVGDDRVWVGHPGEWTITGVDPDGRRAEVVGELPGEPRLVRVTGDGAVWVAVRRAGGEGVDAVVRIDSSTGEPTDTVEVGRSPHGMVVDDAGRLWVNNFLDGTTSVVDTERREVVATFPVPGRPGGLAHGFGSIWISPHRNPVVVRVDPAVPRTPAAVPDVARYVATSVGDVYVRCSGEGANHVVLQPSLHEDSTTWSAVEAALAPEARVCTYDRPEPVGGIDSVDADAIGLHEALASVGASGPFVLVSEGLGVGYARALVTAYPDDVLGVVLVTPWPADSSQRAAAVLVPGGEVADRDLDHLARSWRDPATADFGDRPVSILLHRELPLASGWTDDQAESMRALFDAVRTELSSLSTDATVRLVDRPNQYLERWAPVEVVEAIRDMVRRTA